jgi:two-component system chemotaxis response regulator CheB
MKRRIRVLIVDDSVVIRKLVSDLVSAQDDLEVAGVAANGRIALSKIPQVCPDLVTLDVEMPELDGLATLAELRKTYPRLPVIMFSSQTERAAAATLDALALGANDYVAKPASASGLAAALDRVRDDLLPKLRHFGAPAVAISSGNGSVRVTAISNSMRAPAMRAGSSSRAPHGPTNSLPVAGPRPSTRVVGRAVGIDVVALGCSTGGPNALSLVFARLPADLPVPIVVTQHMPPIFTKLLADRLTANSPVKVHEARNGDVLAPGQAWLAPGDHHLTLQRVAGQVQVRLTQDPPENSCRPAVDVMFRSVASIYGGRALGVILTGMGQDGLRGCQELHDLGAQLVVQDEQSSVVWGMPGFVARAGIANLILPIDEIASEIVRRADRVALVRPRAERLI